jgi:hypothetical protein
MTYGAGAPVSGSQDFRANRFDIVLMQRTKKGRNGRMASRYTTNTTNRRPNIPRKSVNLGESSATNTAGTDVTIARIVSPIQWIIVVDPVEPKVGCEVQLYQHRADAGKHTATPHALIAI